MVVFKRRITSMLFGLVVAPCSGVLVCLVLSIFISSPIIPLAAGVLVLLLLLHSAIFSENIRFEVDGDRLRYIRRGKLEEEFHLPHCAFRYRVVSERSFPPSHDISLYLTDLEADPQGENEVHIDASPIGYRQFAQLQELIERRLDRPVTRLETTKN